MPESKETTLLLSKHLQFLEETKMFYLELLESGLAEEVNNKILKRLHKVQMDQDCFEIILKY